MTSNRIPKSYAALVALLLPKLIPWRRFTIAVDGVDFAGKSSLSRYLAWKLDMPTIETDLALVPNDGTPTHDIGLLKRLIHARHCRNRPVIVEGVLVVQTLAAIDVAPDFLVRVEAAGREGSDSFQPAYRDYMRLHSRASLPDYVVRWRPKL